MILRRLFVISVAAGALLAVSAVGAGETPVLGDYRTKGFLSDYSHFPKEPREDGAGAATKLVGATPFTGEATIELEAIDSVSGQQLAAYIDAEIGKKYAWDEGISKGVSSYMKAYSKWDYTKKAMDEWAQRIRGHLDMVHGKPAEAE